MTACDGVVLMIDTNYAFDSTKISAPAIDGPNEFWKATFVATTSIKSSLIIHNDLPDYKFRIALYTSTFGTNSNIALNPVFMPVGSLTDGGWY